jgi:hypothetical protein
VRHRYPVRVWKVLSVALQNRKRDETEWQANRAIRLKIRALLAARRADLIIVLIHALRRGMARQSKAES